MSSPVYFTIITLITATENLTQSCLQTYLSTSSVKHTCNRLTPTNDYYIRLTFHIDVPRRRLTVQ